MPRVLKPSGNEMIVRIPISLVIKWPTMYRWVFPVGNSVADIPSAIGRMPDQGWPRGNGRRYTLGYLLSRLYMLMADCIKTLGYYLDSSSEVPATPLAIGPGTKEGDRDKCGGIKGMFCSSDL